MRDEFRKTECGVRARFGTAERLAVEIDFHHAVENASPPGIAKFVRCHRHRRKGRRRFRLEKAEPLAELGRNQIAKRYVVDQHHQLDIRRRIPFRHAHRHVAGDHCHLGLHVDSPGLVGNWYRRAWRQEIIGTALIHQRVGPEAVGHLGATGLAHQRHVIDIGRAVSPLVGARKRRMRRSLVKGKALCAS